MKQIQNLLNDNSEHGALQEKFCNQQHSCPTYDHRRNYE